MVIDSPSGVDNRFITPPNRNVIPPNDVEKRGTPDALEKSIVLGISLIKDGKYGQALKHFKNRENAKQAGVELTSANPVPIDPDRSYSPVEIRVRADDFASQCQARANKVVISDFIPQLISEGLIEYYTLDPSIIEARRAGLPQELLHEGALEAAEEWIHALQNILHKPVVGYVSTEIDVAVYLQQQGLELTSPFLSRYGRVRVLSPHSVLSQGDTFLSLRIGSSICLDDKGKMGRIIDLFIDGPGGYEESDMKAHVQTDTGVIVADHNNIVKYNRLPSTSTTT